MPGHGNVPIRMSALRSVRLPSRANGRMSGRRDGRGW